MRYFAIIYFCLQGLGTLAWWIVLFIFPVTRKYFMIPTSADANLLAFMGADTTFFIIGSFAIAYALIYEKKWLSPLMFFVSGGIAYASLYCWHLALITNEAVLGAVMMTPPLFISPYLAYFICYNRISNAKN